MNKRSREHQSLATGFGNVDTSCDADVCRRCLDLITGIPFFHQVKCDSIRLITERGPKRVLDAGCGAGTDLGTLASYLPRSCEITGLDASGTLLACAAERTAGFRNRCLLVKGDILRAPFHDGTFDACRIDRVLQHLHGPGRAIRELGRILAPGGMLVAFDNDWDTFSISLDDQDTAARITRFWRDSFASGRIGRNVPAILHQCGFEEICTEPRKLILNNLPLAGQVFDLSHLLERMTSAGVLTPEKAVSVRKELQRRQRTGTFSAEYTGFLVWGEKPG